MKTKINALVLYLKDSLQIPDKISDSVMRETGELGRK